MVERWCAILEDLDDVVDAAHRHDAAGRAAAFALFDAWAATAGLLPATAEAPRDAPATADAVPEAPLASAGRRG
jgi:hypothetical protein